MLEWNELDWLERKIVAASVPVRLLERTGCTANELAEGFYRIIIEVNNEENENELPTNAS